MQFIQKCPQISQKMSVSNACMLATFLMSDEHFRVVEGSETMLILLFRWDGGSRIWKKLAYIILGRALINFFSNDEFYSIIP